MPQHTETQIATFSTKSIQKMKPGKTICKLLHQD